MSRAAALLQQAMLLSEPERMELAEGLLGSLQLPMAEEIRHAWTEEVERRLAAIARGEVQSVPASAVFDGLRRKYGA